MDLVDLINRYTPPSNPMEYLTEQGYFVLIRDEYNQLIPYCEGKPRNMGDVLIVVNNNLMFPPISNRMPELIESSDTIRCEEVMEMLNDEQETEEVIDLTKSSETQEEMSELTASSDILRCEEVMEMLNDEQETEEVIDLTKLTASSDILRCDEVMEMLNDEQETEEVIDLTKLTASSDILRCDEVMEMEVSKIESVSQPKQNIKFIIKDVTPRSECYWKECYDYIIIKNKILDHIRKKSKEEIVVCGSLEDLKALNTEILYHKGISKTKFIF